MLRGWHVPLVDLLYTRRTDNNALKCQAGVGVVYENK
jgi:hypothetical protein